ncbi:cardiolipin synthase [Shimia sp. FJ5]|uniref:cardiolipin synthase n=1 Tax=Shimia sp. FJ5 TaxID=3079054 RepID=UPI0026298602|nr:cardiolipin synthase [Shimia sp. FJ5]MDV4144285.1 cardiolipin synthase [Shimia sp. FJ5]
MTASLSLFALILLEVVAVIFAMRAMRSARTPQGAVAWVVFLLAAPYLAVISYLFLGHRKHLGYVVARRASQRVLDGIEQARQLFPPKGNPAPFPAFERLAASRVLSGNDFELLIDGEETFSRIFNMIDAADEYILLQFYILRDDEIGAALAERLRQAATRGVRVYVLYDAIGSSRLTRAYLKRLTKAGIRILDSNALRGPSNRRQINFRNHRKCVIVDGKQGFIGGLNVGDEYLGHGAMGPWRDTACVLHGPVVSQLQLVYCEDWIWATDESLFEYLNWEAGTAAADKDALLLASGPADEFETGTLYFCTAAQMAQVRLWIASPYFVPEGDVMSALKVAAMRGVDVRILVPARADHWATFLAGYACFDEMREAGVGIYLYDTGFMHQKSMVVDDQIASVGTINLDSRSCRLNFEATALIFDREAASAVAEMLKADFDKSTPLTKPLSAQPLWIRLLAPVARLFSPLL